MVDTKPRAGGQILDRETLGAVVVDVGAQLCKAAHVVLLLGVIQHLLAVLAVLIPPEDREKCSIKAMISLSRQTFVLKYSPSICASTANSWSASSGASCRVTRRKG